MDALTEGASTQPHLCLLNAGSRHPFTTQSALMQCVIPIPSFHVCSRSLLASPIFCLRTFVLRKVLKKPDSLGTILADPASNPDWPHSNIETEHLANEEAVGIVSSVSLRCLATAYCCSSHCVVELFNFDFPLIPLRCPELLGDTEIWPKHSFIFSCSSPLFL